MTAEELPEGLNDREDTTEEHSFDELARGLASGALSRGRALKLAGAALLGGALGIFGLTAPAEARRRRRCARCTTDNPSTYPAGYCCLTFGGTSGCLVPSSVCDNPPSGTECTCEEPCSATNPCPGGQCCSNGQCVSSCPSGQCCSASVGGQCVTSCPTGQCCSDFGFCGAACPAGSAVPCCPHEGFPVCCPAGSQALCCAAGETCTSGGCIS